MDLGRSGLKSAHRGNWIFLTLVLGAPRDQGEQALDATRPLPFQLSRHSLTLSCGSLALDALCSSYVLFVVRLVHIVFAQ
jgi:hypothetical protein